MKTKNNLWSDEKSNVSEINLSKKLEFLKNISLIKKFPTAKFGAHLHSNPKTSIEKIEAAFNSGCQRFDGALKGFGGCPMAKDELVGNMATETIISFLDSKQVDLKLDREEFGKAMMMADGVFS